MKFRLVLSNGDIIEMEEYLGASQEGALMLDLRITRNGEPPSADLWSTSIKIAKVDAPYVFQAMADYARHTSFEE